MAELQYDRSLDNVKDTNMKSTYIHKDSSRILYVNSFNISMDNVTGTVNYVIEIRNVESEVIDLFYNNPDLSFLRMALDYFFIDYYFINNKNNELIVDENTKINKKYNEDSIQFNRRITRLYLGKLEEILTKKSALEEIKSIFNNKLNNQYYINNMLEKIDNIANHTYEGQSPFGSILFFSSKVLKTNLNLVEYTIRFQSDDLVALNDAKLIRKLLELTNNEKDLYLISDHEMIYGLGKINWNQLKDCILFKIDFNGLSKYNIHLITVEENESNNGILSVENGKKVYKISKNLEVIDKNLINISFKTPIMGVEGYTSEKFIRLLKSKYFDEELKVNEEVVEYLEQVVMYAREQKHGTMVVITDYETAVSELKTLKKQSILIEATEINPEYIQFLTSIDGAIYFDTNGKCHAIGVILDGIAKENIGDARRGARYNSAYRYLEKLKGQKKKCVIVIISEDGMVNLIPETENEEKVYKLCIKLINLIEEYNGNDDSEINEIENTLMSNENTDYHLFFKVAETYRGKGCYEKAIKYYEKGFSSAGRNIILVKNYRYLAILYSDYIKKLFLDYNKKLKLDHTKNTNSDSAKKLKRQIKQHCEKARECYDKYVVKSNENELAFYDYNGMGVIYKALGDLEGSKESRQVFYEKAVQDYSKAIEILNLSPFSGLDASKSIIFSNRANAKKNMGMNKEYLDDLIEAELIYPNENNINSIIDLVKKDIKWIDYCVQRILKDKDNKLKGSNLIKKLEEYMEGMKEINPEIAVSLEKLNQ
ncbi:diadenylate cyclase [Bacillus cereus]